MHSVSIDWPMVITIVSIAVYGLAITGRDRKEQEAAE